MNMDNLKTFIELVKLGSFSEVARKLSISQPAVSFQIQKLERDLEIRLIDRGQKTISLTEAGKRLLSFAELVERERVRLTRDLEKLRDEITGELSLAASTIPGEFLLPITLSEFKLQHPAVSVTVAVSDSSTVVSGVREGTYEVGFCGIRPEGQGLDLFKIAEDEIVLIAFPEHPFAQRKKISLMELEREPLICRAETSGTQQSIESFLSKAGLDPRRLVHSLVLGSTQAVVSAVEARAGIAFVSNLAINKSLSLGLVSTVEVEGVRLKRDFFCIYRQERLVSRLIEEFIAFVRARASQTSADNVRNSCER